MVASTFPSQKDSQHRERSNLLTFSMLVGGAGLLLLLLVWYWPFTVDDAFISFRYSENLALGYGPTYNPGVLPRAEGYTSLSWMVIMALPHLFGWDALLFSKLLGVVATLGILAVSARFTYDLTAFLELAMRRVCAAFVVLMLVAFYPLALHAVSGMETALYTLLLTSFLYVAYRYLGAPTQRGALLLAGAALALSLTRPEGNLAAAVTFVSLAVLIPRQQRRALLITVSMGYIVPAIIYFVSRFAYYGLPLPIPFYIKVEQQPLFAGWNDVQGFAAFVLFHVGVFLVFGCIRLDKTLAPSLLTVVSLLLFFLFPAAIMGYDWRYCFPVAPFLFVLAGRGFAVMLQWLNGLRQTSDLPHSPALAAPWAVLPALCVITILGLLDGASADVVNKNQYASMWNDKTIPLGKQLRDLTPALSRSGHVPTVALIDAGAIPYYSGWRAIDTYTLNDPVIALSGKRDPQYVLGNKPDVLALISVDPDKFVPFIDSEGPLYEASLSEGMVKAGVLALRNSPPYYYWIMVPSRSPILAQLSQASYVSK